MTLPAQVRSQSRTRGQCSASKRSGPAGSDSPAGRRLPWRIRPAVPRPFAKHVASFEPEHAGSLDFGEFLVVGAALAAHHGRKNRDALLTLADMPAKFEPKMIASDVTRFGALAVDKKRSEERRVGKECRSRWS